MKFLEYINLYFFFFFVILLIGGIQEFYEHYSFMKAIQGSFCGTPISNFQLLKSGAHCPGCPKILLAFSGLFFTILFGSWNHVKIRIRNFSKVQFYHNLRRIVGEMK